MIRRCILILIVLFQGHIIADQTDQPDGKIQLSDEHHYLEPHEKTALVYLINQEGWFYTGMSKRKAIYLDQKPLGYLVPRSYIATRIQPGVRCLLTSGAGGPGKQWDWFDFKPGRTYVLFRETHYDYSQPAGTANDSHAPQVSVSSSKEWWLSWPRDIREIVASLELRHVTTTEAGMLALENKGWGELFERKASSKRMLKQRAEARVELPLMESTKLPCKMVEEREVFKRGRVTIDFMGLVWQSKAKRIEIPIAEIRRVESTNYNILIGYGPEDEMRTLVLYTGSNDLYRRILQHLLEAIRSAEQSSDLPG